MADVKIGPGPIARYITIEPPARQSNALQKGVQQSGTRQSGAQQSGARPSDSGVADSGAADLDEADSEQEDSDEPDSDGADSDEEDPDESDSDDEESAEIEGGIPLSMRLPMLRLLAMDPGPSPSSHPEEPPAVNHTKGSGRTARASLARHKRKCAVCHHPDRETIEQDFLRWCSPDDLARNFGIKWRSTIYRHMHATGLVGQRRANLRFALEPIIEQAYNVRSKADSIIRAVRTYAHINDDGQWVEPVKTLVVGPREPAARVRIRGEPFAESRRRSGRRTVV